MSIASAVTAGQQREKDGSQEYAGRPGISVCMAAYNGERYITAQLQSILVQLSDNDEVVVVDDGACFSG